ncbi:MAG: asparagine synthase (glutamine-hydrolyzing) [Puniceicoccaceae bacterium]
MCGIAGVFTRQRLDSRHERAIGPMLEQIRHRGPDSQKHYADAENGLLMGHTRLIINDFATGEQPLFEEQGDLVLTVNGEFYDFKKHRSRAMAEGHRFATKSDSEVVLPLYRKHGLAFTEHLRGEFAFTLFDRKKQELILVRDRFGIRPLFFHLSNDTLVYGSEAKAVLAHPDVPRQIDPKAVMHQMMQTTVPGMSSFVGIRALEPGRMLRVRRTADRLEVSEHSYWDYEFPEMEAREPMSEEAAIEQVREKLIESIVLRLEADVPVGCYLSGGIDSCCILGLASGAMQSPVKAFTISFDHDSYDESAIAVEMAQSMQADHEMIRLQADDLYGDNYVNTVFHAERSFYNTLGVAKNLMSRRVWQCDYRTVITGEGADELFAGYPALKRDHFLHGLKHLPEKERQLLHAQLEKSNQLFKGAILAEDQLSHPAFDDICGFTPSWIQPWMATLELIKPLLSADVKAALGSYDPIEGIVEKLDAGMIRGRHPLDMAQYTWSKTQLEGQILNWGGDRVDMANSMESRPAFLDHHLAQVATRIPPEYRIKGNTEKWVLREAVKGVLPEVLYKREKFAFMAPPAHTDPSKKRRLQELLDTYVNESRIRTAGLFDPVAVKHFLEAYHADQDPVSLTRKDTVVNHLLCLQIMDSLFIQR